MIGAPPELSRQAGPRSALRTRLFSLAAFLECQPALVFTALTFVYALAVLATASRPLWHDELFTFYISHAATLDRFWEEVRRLDLNPPLLYLSTRLANALFGLSPAATRLPSIVAFYGASLLFFVYLRRKMGTLWSTAAILLFWSGPFLMYSVEARPYGLLLFFFAVTLVCYDRAVNGRREPWAVAGIALGALGMVASHVFSPFSIGPFLLAELVRFYKTRKNDYPVWAALLLPLGCVVFYRPLLSNFQAILFPDAFQASPRTLLRFFVTMTLWSSPAIAALAVGTLAATAPTDRDAAESHWKWTDGAIGVGLMMVPFLLTAMMMRSHGAFWDRYCITTGFAVPVLFTAWISWRFANQRVAALGASLLLSAVLLYSGILQPWLASRKIAPTAAVLEGVHRDLPLAVASGITFLEMDHNEAASLKSRLFYLEDRPSAIRYAHATLFEGFHTLVEYFPIAAHVEKLTDFEREHRQFLVLSRPNWPENWLIPKLRDDGHRIEPVGEFSIPYADKQLFLVTLR